MNNFIAENSGTSKKKLDQILALQKKGPDGVFKVHKKTV